jgi:predicted transcriptional regulator
MTKKSERVTAFVTVETKKAMQQLADKQNRSLSNLAGTILAESVKEKK